MVKQLLQDFLEGIKMYSKFYNKLIEAPIILSDL